MKRKRYLSLFMALMLLAALLAGCGSSKSAAGSPAAQPEKAYAQEDVSLRDTGSPGSVQPPENRKWIITGEIHGETEDLDSLLDGVYEQVAALGGYIEDQNVYNGSGSKSRYRSAELTVRIPVAQVDAFTEAVSEASNVVSSSRNLEDVTLSYVDNETRLEALKIEEARLMALMENAENMSDLLEIEKRLTEVHYEMERITSQLRTYDNQIDFATIHLNLEEVTEYTPVEPTLWERISGGFRSSLVGVKGSLVDLFVWIIVKSPYLVVWGVIIVLIALVIRAIEKRNKNKKPIGKKPMAGPDGNVPGAPSAPPAPPVPPVQADSQDFAPFPPKNKEK